MQVSRFVFFSLGMVWLHVATWAQTDSLKAAKYPTRYFTEYSLDRNLPMQLEDTVVNRNEIYHPMYREYGVFQDQGNIGTAGRSQFFSWNRKADFNWGFNPWQTYFKTIENTRYYQTKRPYADFSYTQGQKELLLFKAKFTMNLTPRLNFGVDYDRVTSQGFYPRQYTSGYFTNVFSSYHSKNNRYGLLANFISNKGLQDESGGIISDSLFETLRGTNKAVSVWLGNSQSRYRTNTWYAKQYFYLGRMNTRINNDDTSYAVDRVGFISHTIRYDYDRFFFDNPNGDTSSFLFPPANLDSTGIFHDSISMRSVMNRVTWAMWTKSNERQQSFVELGVSHKYIEMKQWDVNHFYHNVWAEARLERIPRNEKNIGIKAEGAYCVSGYNNQDFKAGGELSWLSGNFVLRAGLTNQLMEPDYAMVHYRSAPFTWENKFSKINVTNWHGALSTKKFRHNFHLNFHQYLIANYAYYGTSITPEQTSKILLINTLELNKTFQFGWVMLENRILYQKANLDVIRLPELAAQLRYYVKGSLFKKALYFQLGTELFFNTAYYANAWHPSIRAFYLQDEVKTGNYPLLDVFVTGQIKSAIIFFKLEHASMDWMNTGFYATPHYPLPVRTTRLGIRWRMYN